MNERHYGFLTGQIKSEAKEKLGDERFLDLRRGYATRPDPLAADNEHALSIAATMKNVVPEGKVPSCESLADCVVRVAECWEQVLCPAAKAGQRILLSAHGNSLRSLVKLVEGISDEGIRTVEFGTGKPFALDFDENGQFVARRNLTA